MKNRPDELTNRQNGWFYKSLASSCVGIKQKGAGLKRQGLFLCGCVMGVMFLAQGTEQETRAQTQPDPVATSDQGNQPARKTDDPSLLNAGDDHVNYAIGVQLIGNLKRQGVSIDLEWVIKGMRDAYSSKELLISDAEIRKALVIYQEKVKRTQATLRNASLEENKKKGDAFLAENRKKEGVTTLPSGLQYRVIRTGGGKKPNDADTVSCHYLGTLIDGEEFDSSYRRGRPSTFKVKSVIPGWREALKLMPEGSKWQIFIPSHLAYGERGAGNLIQPGDALVFEVEVLAVK